ncbi:thioredoxin family protein [bacterium]|nr:thioredoxin family protein [bacterium]
MNDFVQIRVGKNKIGISGLKKVLEEAVDRCRDMTDEQIGQMLVEELSQNNYIVPDLRDEYAQAFLREFKKHIGETVAEAFGEILEIKVLGPGCPRCERLEREVMEILVETGIKADLEHVRDIAEIGRYGAVVSPALVINGKIITSGVVPSRTKLKALLIQADNTVQY